MRARDLWGRLRRRFIPHRLAPARDRRGDAPARDEDSFVAVAGRYLETECSILSETKLILSTLVEEAPLDGVRAARRLLERVQEAAVEPKARPATLPRCVARKKLASGERT